MQPPGQCNCYPCCEAGGLCGCPIREQRQGPCCATDTSCCPPSCIKEGVNTSPSTKKNTAALAHPKFPWESVGDRQTGAPVVVSVVGDATLEAAPLKRNAHIKRRHSTGHGDARQSSGGQSIVVFTEPTAGLPAQAYARLTINGPGPILVVVVSVAGYALFTPASVVINAESCEGEGVVQGSPVAKLLLSPAKAYRHCDTITLSALAVDANSAPVANATVAFSAYGDCEPTTQQLSAVTDGNGIVTITMLSGEPGAVSVVAATTNTQGVPVFSQPAHIFFFNERHHADEREREYFGEEYDGEHRHSDADEYAKIASQRAGQKMALTA